MKVNQTDSSSVPVPLATPASTVGTSTTASFLRANKAHVR